MSRFIISGDGTEVTDNQTVLIWKRCAEGQVWNGSTCTGMIATYTHKAALAQAEAASTGKAWRLPDVNELFSLVDRTRSNPAIDADAFPCATSGFFWSSSPLVSYADYAWFVFFGNGDGNYYGRGSRSNHYAVRLVRDNR